jgi:capsid protein
MNPLGSWKTGLCLLGIVAATGLSGGLIGHRVARSQLEARNNPETWNEHVAREFDRIVKPTPDQGARIQASLDSAVRELQAIRLDTIARSTDVIWRLIAEVERELTPEQRQAFETMKPKPAEVTLEVLDLPPDNSAVQSPAP